MAQLKGATEPAYLQGAAAPQATRTKVRLCLLFHSFVHEHSSAARMPCSCRSWFNGMSSAFVQTLLMDRPRKTPAADALTPSLFALTSVLPERLRTSAMPTMTESGPRAMCQPRSEEPCTAKLMNSV